MQTVKPRLRLHVVDVTPWNERGLYGVVSGAGVTIGCADYVAVVSAWYNDVLERQLYRGVEC